MRTKIRTQKSDIRNPNAIHRAPLATAAQYAFTLIELLLVIVILGILAAIVVP